MHKKEDVVVFVGMCIQLKLIQYVVVIIKSVYGHFQLVNDTPLLIVHSNLLPAHNIRTSVQANPAKMNCNDWRYTLEIQKLQNKCNSKCTQ